MKIISMYFPEEHITILINEWFEGLSKDSDISSFNILSTTQVNDGVLIIIEVKELGETNSITDTIINAIDEGFQRNMDNIKLKVDIKEIAKSLDKATLNM